MLFNAERLTGSDNEYGYPFAQHLVGVFQKAEGYAFSLRSKFIDSGHILLGLAEVVSDFQEHLVRLWPEMSYDRFRALQLIKFHTRYMNGQEQENKQESVLLVPELELMPDARAIICSSVDLARSLQASEVEVNHIWQALRGDSGSIGNQNLFVTVCSLVEGDSFNQSAQHALEGRNLDEALDFSQKALEYDPLNLQAHQRKGFIYWAQDKFHLALSSFLAAASINPDDSDLKEIVGKLEKELVKQKEQKLRAERRKK